MDRTQIRWLLAVALVWGAGGAAIADESGSGDAPPGVMPHEQTRDKPAAVRAVRTAPALSRAQLTVSGYTSVQVNVDALGDDILGDAANEPSIAIDPTNPNRIVIGWRQFDDVTSDFREAGWAYSQDGGQTWTFPGAVREGVFGSDPVLDVDSSGNFYYCTLTDNFNCEVFKSIDGGQSWSAPAFAYGGDKEWMVVDHTGGAGDGNVYCVWRPDIGGYSGTPFTRSTDGGQTFDGPFALPPQSPFWSTMTIGPDGTLYVAGVVDALQGNSLYYVAKSTDAQYAGSVPTFTIHPMSLGGAMVFLNAAPNPGGLLGVVWLASDHSGGPYHGNIYMMATLWPPGAAAMDAHFARSTDGGQTWSTPVRLNDDPADSSAWQWFGTLSVAPNGRIDAIWNDTRNGPSPLWSQVYYTYSYDAGATWADNIVVTPLFDSHAGWPQQTKIGDYYQMISDEVTANLAYSATFTGGEDIYFVRMGDCNGNGVHDGLDLAAGTSSDLNTNSQPDECEPDCNGNTVPDDWDIAVGTSMDCNANGRPDECDLAAGHSLDCNANAVPDECDIAAGSSGDCNVNGVPDECDVASGASLDCNASGTPDECELAANPNLDCNGNAVLDECDIAAGASVDCNVNGRPDECDLAAGFTSGSARLSPLGNGFPQTHTITALRPALPGAAVTLAFEAVGDLNFSSEKVNVYLNDVWVDEVFGSGTGAHDCPAVPDADQTVLTADTWNAAAASGAVAIRMVTTSGVDPQYCQPYTWITVAVSYDAEPASTDCNSNAVPDECDIAGGGSADTNLNAVPDECETCRGDANGDGSIDEADVPYFAAALSGQAAWVGYWQSQSGSPPTCPWANCDVNGDGRVTFGDLRPFVSLLGTTCAAPE